MPSEPLAPMDAAITDEAWRALEGAYDLQVHVGPDVIARGIDDIDCAKEFLAHGMHGFVLAFLSWLFGWHGISRY